MTPDSISELQALLSREPWRQRYGHPNKVDDPLFLPIDHNYCTGEVEYEPGSKYWTCKDCGYIGWATTSRHYPVLPPEYLYNWAKSYYRIIREKECSHTAEEITKQMKFIISVALKKAATIPATQLHELVEKIENL